MSLLGRLEDLSLTDIIQIVFLSRRTGVLEIIDGKGRHTVLFRAGLVANASSPDHPDLVSYLLGRELIPEEGARMLRKMEESGIPYGTATVELNLMSPADLGNAIRARILDVVTPLLQSREGEFNFILSESMSPLDVEYDPEMIFREGGLSPQRIVGGGEGEKIKPLKGLEESLKAGKALLRGSAPADTTPASLNLGLGQPLNPPKTDNVVPFPTPEAEQPTAFTPVPDEPLPEIQDEIPPRDFKRPESGKFKVSGGLIEVESPEATYRNVVLFERNPLVRVAARRAFTKHGVKIFQYGSLPEGRGSPTDPLRAQR